MIQQDAAAAGALRSVALGGLHFRQYQIAIGTGEKPVISVKGAVWFRFHKEMYIQRFKAWFVESGLEIPAGISALPEF